MNLQNAKYEHLLLRGPYAVTDYGAKLSLRPQQAHNINQNRNFCYALIGSDV